MSTSEESTPKPPGMRTLSVSRSEIDERDPTLHIVPDQGTPRTELLVQKILDIGSESSLDVSLPDVRLATRHARLSLEGGNYRIYDLTGKNGVLVNGQPVDTQVLRDGNTVRLQNAAGLGVTMTYSNPIERALSTASAAAAG